MYDSVSVSRVGNGCGVPFWGDENVLKLVAMVAHLCEYTQKHGIVFFTCVNCFIFELNPLMLL